MGFKLEKLPFLSQKELETAKVLRQLARSHRQIAELKGAAGTIPNESILIDTLALQEAKDSSEIENIITTQDELYQGDSESARYPSVAAREVHHYSKALKTGFDRIRKKQFLRLNDVLAIQNTLLDSRVGLRSVAGTVLKNQLTGAVVYEPPQDRDEIERLMANLLEYFHLEDDETQIDPLIRMALLHHQFESIHPFYDGNGRTGRILNLLFLALHNLLDLPVLYLSRYIVRNKADYYQLLQSARDKADWEDWVLYMLKAVESTARETLAQVKGIRELMASTKSRLRTQLPKLYSQDLLNNLFRHPYTKIEFVERDLSVSRPTAMKYLSQLDEYGIVKKVKIGRTNFYINQDLCTLLTR
ncbi:Fic protein family [Verrucomicrobiia bacterium DG1235]|nr:Fic protein family [Verrucomicrobiae bacterium DG1235]